MLAEKEGKIELRLFEQSASQPTNSLSQVLFRIEAVMKEAPMVAIQGFDRWGVICHWNIASEHLYGYSGTEAIGRRVQDILLTGEGIERFERTLGQIWNSGNAAGPEEWIVKTASNQQRLMHSTMFPVLEDGEVKQVFSLDVDITEHKLTEESLRKSEQRYKTLLETIPYGIEEIDRAGCITFANKSLHKIYGYPEGQLIGKKIYDLSALETDRDKLCQRFAAMTKEQLLPIPYETRSRTEDGRIIDLQVNWNYKREDSGKATGFIAVVTDISDRKRAEEALKKSEERFRSFMETARDLMYMTDKAGYFTYVNKSMARTLGYSKRELVGMHITGILSKQDLKFFKPKREELRVKGQISLETVWIAKNGKTIHGELTVVGIYDDKGVFSGSRAVFHDITDRKHAEDEILELNRELEKRVTRRTVRLIKAHRQLLQEVEERKSLEKEILGISEREKRLVGQELHDSIGQQFAGIAFMTKVLEQRLAEKDPEEAKKAAQIAQLVNDAMEQARGLAKGLHPVDLNSGNLSSALEELAITTGKLFNVHCDLKCDRPYQEYSAETAVHIYRIVQEAITNAVKHGNAKNIHIGLARATNKSVLTVKSDGRDFPHLSRGNSGMGLHIIDHRVEMIGGSKDIRQGEQNGTILTCVFPNK